MSRYSSVVSATAERLVNRCVTVRRAKFGSRNHIDVHFRAPATTGRVNNAGLNRAPERAAHPLQNVGANRPAPVNSPCHIRAHRFRSHLPDRRTYAPIDVLGDRKQVRLRVRNY
ncbi:hypothetical protein D3C74_447780 [compost metagenome]